MSTFILTWNPTRWDWKNFDTEVIESQDGRIVNKSWSAGVRRKVEIGDSVYLFRQSSERGIIASGRTKSSVYEGDHWDGSGRRANLVNVDFDHILPISDVLPADELNDANLGVKWINIQASGSSIPEESVDPLKTLWEDHLIRIGYNFSTPDEVQVPARFFEGATRTISVNSYERSVAARKACIEHHGLSCSVCDFDFEATYGELGKGFIHVHHLTDLATIREEYEINPIKDLRPVCPNCHAMLHRPEKTMSIESLRAQL
ncbi:HNH endonuclease [Polystyrenella longa]|uniref:HNH endonuclease n=1 Tax=Polystyrenella longa TaxID=2528007 RepID=A0A518CMP7_9PLAN|nr:HNH endonuclease [Polystyrenella longa]QDU80506.1 HNH endonuclease [Polystyrenella longa]